MRIIRIIFGVLACLFILMHLLELPQFLAEFERVPENLHASRWIGKAVAILIGTAIALACFRGTKKKQGRQEPHATETSESVPGVSSEMPDL